MRSVLLSSVANFAPEMGGRGNLPQVTSQGQTQRTNGVTNPGNDTQQVTGNDTQEGGDPEDFFGNNADLWEPPEVDPATAPKEPTSDELEAAAQKTASKLDNYVKSMTKVEIDPTKFQEAIDNKDPKFFQEVVSTAIQTAHKNMLNDAAKMVREMQTSLRAEMDTAAQRRLAADKSVDSLLATIPFAADPVLKPIATAIKAQFLKKGADDTKANAMVKQFFAKTAELTADSLEDPTHPPSTRTGDRTYNSPRRQKVEEPNWADILRAQP